MAQNAGRGVVLHVQVEVYQSNLTFKRKVARYQEWCPWSIQPKIFTSQFCPKSNLIKDKIPVLGLDIFARSSFLLVSEKIEHRVQINMYLLHHRCITAQIFNIDCGWFIKYPISKHNKNNPLFNIIAADSRRGRCRPRQIPPADCAASQACGVQT